VQLIDRATTGDDTSVSPREAGCRRTGHEAAGECQARALGKQDCQGFAAARRLAACLLDLFVVLSDRGTLMSRHIIGDVHMSYVAPAPACCLLRELEKGSRVDNGSAHRGRARNRICLMDVLHCVVRFSSS
jgi:hypothetical protein